MLREAAPQVLATLVRRYGSFDACEDAVQEALISASRRWSVDGIPENPRGWLTTVASRRLVDEWRSESARRRREERVTTLEVADGSELADRDDTLTLVFLCCHPTLSAASRIALTLRAVGGLTTAEIASAFLVPEATMAQRISRAKATLASRDVRFELPSQPERDERLASVLHVLYLVFNEGYTASSGDALQRTDLTKEAIRLARLLHELVPDEAEVTGLLGLMLLTEARRAARTDPDGLPVPLAEQDRSRWDAALIVEARTMLEATAGKAIGPYRIQAAIATLHDEASDADATDWPRILALYDVLEHVAPGPVVALNRAVAVAMVRGPSEGLEILERLDTERRLERSHRLDAVRAHLLEMAGRTDAARDAYRAAARKAASVPERRYLSLRAARLG
ncbi:MAG TPA: sigma-70 family RNA polymerase sigma factor [Actinomycetota bacterium]|nr:sigma-70 family RNA polymerase sigma factor [Actinomycetota bacterium]